MKLNMLVAVALSATAVSAFAVGDESEPIGVFTDPEKSSFWQTGKSNDFFINLDYPDGATSVVVSVIGSRYQTTYPETSAPGLRILLPEVTSVESENVYRMTLSFSDGTVKSCLFGLVESQALGSSATVRVAPTTDPAVWNKSVEGKVMAVPYGTTALAIDDKPVDPADYGVQGWYALPRVSPGAHVFSTVVGETLSSVTLTRDPEGFQFMIK